MLTMQLEYKYIVIFKKVSCNALFYNIFLIYKFIIFLGEYNII